MISTQTSVQRKSFVKNYESYYSTLFYHNIFDFPLTANELVTWFTPIKIKKTLRIKKRADYVFLQGRENILAERKKRQKWSLRKLVIAKNVSKILTKIPTIKMIGITGSLSMMNADLSSDIDFMVVAQSGTLWTTRLLAFFLLKLKNIPTRRFGDNNEKNKICLNLWLDESSLVWKKRNIFTAHEIAQVLPILEKDWTYQEFLRKNKWIKKYWPNAVVFLDANKKVVKKDGLAQSLIKFIEPLAYFLQRVYMFGKITKEEVGRSKAAFHPINWSEVIKNKFDNETP